MTRGRRSRSPRRASARPPPGLVERPLAAYHPRMPDIDFAFLADAAETIPGQKFHVLGGGVARIGGRRFPLRHPHLALVIGLQVTAPETDREHEIRFVLLDPDGGRGRGRDRQPRRAQPARRPRRGADLLDRPLEPDLSRRRATTRSGSSSTAPSASGCRSSCSRRPTTRPTGSTCWGPSRRMTERR